MSIITISELKERLKDGHVVLIDVREPWEYEMGHLKGSVNIPVSNFTHSSFNLDVPKDKTVITICEHGIRSLYAAHALEKKGYKALSMQGGMSEWDGPVEG